MALAGICLLACGDGSDDDASADAIAASDNASNIAGDIASGDSEAVDTARDIAQRAIDDTSSDARATVVIDGATYQFQPLQPGPDDDFYSFCTVVADSLQAGMQLVDDTGERIEGGELEFIFLEPGGAYERTGDPAELMIVLPEHNGIGFVADEIDAPASGRTASGTFTASTHLGDSLSGTIDASC